MNEGKKRTRGDEKLPTPNKKNKVNISGNVSIIGQKEVTNVKNTDRTIGPFSSKTEINASATSSSGSSSSSLKSHVTNSSKSNSSISGKNLNELEKLSVAQLSSSLTEILPPHEEKTNNYSVPPVSSTSSSSSSVQSVRGNTHVEEKEEKDSISNKKSDRTSGPFSSVRQERKEPLHPRNDFRNTGISDSERDMTSSRLAEEQVSEEEEVAEVVSAQASAVAATDNIIEIEIDSDGDVDGDTTSPFLKDMWRRMSLRASPMASVPTNWCQQLQDVADFACKESSVMPTLPAGTLPLLGAMVFFIGVALMAYTGLCSGPGECVDAREFFSSLRIDGESASEFFERGKARVAASISQIDGESTTELFERMKARMSSSFSQIDGESATELYERIIASGAELLERAPSADYVIDQLSQMWKRVCAGKIADLSQLLTDKDIRVAVLMYLGAVIAIAGGYLTIVTMDSSGDRFSFSSFSTTERLASVTESLEKNSAAFAQWRDKTTASISAWRDQQNNVNAPTPLFSVSSFFKACSKAILWLVKTMRDKITEVTRGTREVVNTKIDQQEEIPEDKISAPETQKLTPITIDETPTPSSNTLSSLSPARLRNQFTIFLTAKKPQIYSFLQRLDVTAAILSMMFLLLLAFLYHKRIKNFISICFLPVSGIIVSYGMGKLCFKLYRWFKIREKKRKRKISLIASVAKKQLRTHYNGVAYPVDFLYEELRDMVIDGTFDAGNGHDNGVEFGGFSPLSHGVKCDEVKEIDEYMLKLLWVDVEKEVLSDKRVIMAMMMYEGAKRKCWKTQGRNSSTGNNSFSSPTPNSSVPSGNVMRSNKALNVCWDFIMRISWRIMPSLLLLIFFLSMIRFPWMRSYVWWSFVSFFRFLKYLLFQSLNT